MPVDKFGRMSDTKTKDTGVSLTYINNNYVRSDGNTPISGSLDMRGNTIYNVADPVNPQDVVTKVYVDNTKGSSVIGRKIGDDVSIKENLDFMGKQKIKNLVDPVNEKDAVTKEYVDTTTVPFLKLDQTKYNTKGDIDMRGLYTVYNVKKPNNDSHIVDKKYVDEMDNLKSAFTLINGGYEARGSLYMRKNKLGGLREPTMDGEATTKKYVDDLVTNHFVDENDNIAFGRAVDMEGNKIFSLPEPEQDSDPATKKYVDDLQTQYIDKRGNVKFDRNINVGNNRIFALKDPKKDYEATNKKYVDESITKRIEEEKDNSLPQDPATKQYVDEAIKGLVGGDVLVSKEGVFIKENGHYRATAPLDIDNQKVENLPEPVDEKDAVNKKYVDGIVEDLTLKQGLVRENGGFNLVDSYINMNFNNIRNVGQPKHDEDAVPKSFIDTVVNSLNESTEKTIIDVSTRVGRMLKNRTRIISATASFHGDLIAGNYQFIWGGHSIETHTYHTKFNGFLVPESGKLKKFVVLDTGMKFFYSKDDNFRQYINSITNKPVPLFTLMLFREKEDHLEIGTFYLMFTDYINKEYFFKYKDSIDKNFQLKRKDIINIKTEFDTTFKKDHNAHVIDNINYNLGFLNDNFFTYLATVLIELDPLDEDD